MRAFRLFHLSLYHMSLRRLNKTELVESYSLVQASRLVSLLCHLRAEDLRKLYSFKLISDALNLDILTCLNSILRMDTLPVSIRSRLKLSSAMLEIMMGWQ